MSSEKNTLPAVAAVAGGAVIFLQGVIMTAVPLLSDSASEMTLFYGTLVAVAGLASMVLGASIYSSKKKVNAAAILSLAAVIMLFAGGGFLIGSVLASIGGSLSLFS